MFGLHLIELQRFFRIQFNQKTGAYIEKVIFFQVSLRKKFKKINPAMVPSWLPSAHKLSKKIIEKS